jgi:lipase maturation factor 1
MAEASAFPLLASAVGAGSHGLGLPPQQFLPLLFPRLLGFIYFIALGSLLIQVRGLYGSGGILPIADYLAELRGELGSRAYRISPSIFWFASGDRVLTGACLAGLLLSLLLMAGLAPVPLLILLWLLYLSFVSTGQDFLSFQWDTLLLEVGFMTIFLPLAEPAPPLVVFSYRFMLFRFIVSSGAVKLLSRDETWRNLTAMCHHYQTQPIPNRAAWFAHQLPVPVQKFSTLATLLLELAAPVFALGPGAAPLLCFALTIFLQLLIFATGNFAFFNLLTVVMALPLLDDNLIMPHPQSIAATPAPLSFAVSIIFLLFLILNLSQLVTLVFRPHWLTRLLVALSPFMVSNRYGLFAVMTTSRFEFIIEGSRDGKEWLPYEFRWKPGDPHRPPRQVAPHQPRLDWQMWFAALQPGSMEPWLRNLVLRLLQGSAQVIKLLERNPFPDAPPASIRVSVYSYRFSSRKVRREQGLWWEREHVGKSRPMALNRQEKTEKDLS